MDDNTRRDFLKGTAWMGLAAAAAGCQFERMGFGTGAPMAGFVAPKLTRIRIGLVGTGSRGTYAFKRLALFPNVEVTAICDVAESALKDSRAFVAEKKLRPPREFLGAEAYRDLCQWDGVDVVEVAEALPAFLAAGEGPLRRGVSLGLQPVELRLHHLGTDVAERHDVDARHHRETVHRALAAVAEADDADADAPKRRRGKRLHRRTRRAAKRKPRRRAPGGERHRPHPGSPLQKFPSALSVHVSVLRF